MRGIQKNKSRKARIFWLENKNPEYPSTEQHVVAEVPAELSSKWGAGPPVSPLKSLLFLKEGNRHEIESKWAEAIQFSMLSGTR